MASSRKKRSRAVVTLLLCLAAVCIVAALVLYGLANRKLKALQQGADFEFTYAVTSQGGTTHPALYSILDQAGATEGRMTGLYSPGQLQLYLYSRDAATTETSGDNFFTCKNRLSIGQFVTVEVEEVMDLDLIGVVTDEHPE